MWSRGLRASFSRMAYGRNWGPESRGQPRTPRVVGSRNCSASAAAFSGGFQAIGTQVAGWVSRLSGGFVLGSGSVLMLQNNKDRAQADGAQPSTSELPWVQELADKSEEVLAPSAALRSHPVAKLFVDQDHLFETMVTSKQIHEFRCFYETAARKFHSVVQLGRDVCGFPQTVHGGLTAAIIDETLGGLGVCMWQSGALGARPPAYTARLEVDYKRKIPAGSTILVSTELEAVDGRKIWMRATVSDGASIQYATARALFVAPRMPHEVLLGSITKAATGSKASSEGKQ